MALKSKSVPSALAILVVVILVAAALYWFSGAFVPTPVLPQQNLSAVGAAVSSTGGELATGAIAAAVSSPQPTITVKSWPAFEMKYDGATTESSLAVKSEYSVTAPATSKIFLPLNSPLMEIRNNLGQLAYIAKTETRGLDPVAVATCASMGSCYVVPAGKTVNFVLRQTYNPKLMFGGVYTAKLNWLYFSTNADDPTNLFYKTFPTQTSKLNSITVVGEKSPYLYTTNVTVVGGQPFSIRGVRLTSAKAVLDNNDGSASLSVNSQTDTDATAILYARPGVYTVYFDHPTYGQSNRLQVTVQPSGRPQITFISAEAAAINKEGNDNDTGIFTIKYRVAAVDGSIYLGDKPVSYPVDLSYPEPAESDGTFGLLYTVTKDGRPVDSALQAVFSFTTAGGASEEGVANGIKLEAGESTEITLKITKVNQGNSTDNGVYQARLRAIGWQTFDHPTFKMERDLDYTTPTVNLN